MRDSQFLLEQLPSVLREALWLMGRLFFYTHHMKSMTCNQLGGACEHIFSGETFDEIAAQSQQHGKVMFGANDGPHMEAMSKMMELMKSGEMDSWMAAREAEFDAL